MSVIGALRVIMGIDTAQYESGLRRAETSTRRAQGVITNSFTRMRSAVLNDMRGLAAGIGAGLLASSLLQAGRSAFEFAADLGEASRAIGLTVEQYQILNRAALENGFSMETASRGMGFFVRTLGQAQAGSQSALRAFQQIGISAAQLRSFRSVEEALRAVMDRLQRLGTIQAQTAAGSALFSRSYREMSNWLSQGAAGYDEVARAARAAGLITEEQARQADEASDELAVLGHTLMVGLGSAIVNLMPLMRGLVGLLVRIGSAAGWAFGQIGSLIARAARWANENNGWGAIGPMAGLVALFGDRSSRSGGGGWFEPRPAAPSAELDLSNGGGGGGRRRGGGGNARAAAERAMRDAAQYQGELRQHRIAELRAREDQTQDIVEQNAIRDQIAGLEREEYVARQALDVQLHERTQAEADALIAAYDRTALAERQTRIQTEINRGAEERRDLADLDYEQAAERLRLDSDAATTAAERRAIELRLLDLTHQHERQKQTELMEAAQRVHDVRGEEEARRRIAQLDETYGAARSQVLRNTRGPLESFLAELPTTAARANEALQAVAVNGLQSLTDGLVEAIMGARSLADAFKKMAQSIIADLLRIVIQQNVIAPLARMLGGTLGGGGGLLPKIAGSLAGASTTGLKGFASGGSFQVGGMAGVDRNVLSINGLPRARVSGSETLSITPAGAGGGVTVHQHFSIDGSNAATRQDLMQLASMVKPLAMEAYQDWSRRR